MDHIQVFGIFILKRIIVQLPAELIYYVVAILHKILNKNILEIEVSNIGMLKNFTNKLHNLTPEYYMCFNTSGQINIMSFYDGNVFELKLGKNNSNFYQINSEEICIKLDSDHFYGFFKGIDLDYDIRLLNGMLTFVYKDKVRIWIDKSEPNLLYLFYESYRLKLSISVVVKLSECIKIPERISTKNIDIHVEKFESRCNKLSKNIHFSKYDLSYLFRFVTLMESLSTVNLSIREDTILMLEGVTSDYSLRIFLPEIDYLQ